jgi:hypothetical protein
MWEGRDKHFKAVFLTKPEADAAEVDVDTIVEARARERNEKTSA